MAAIANTPPVPVEEYISRFVERGEKPTCEYIDGVLVPKSMASKKQIQVQANIIALIRNLYDETLNPLPELTTRLRETQFYVPDLAIEELARPIQGRYPGSNDPVLLCVETVVRDVEAILQRVANGLEVIIERDTQAVAVLRAASPPRRTFAECIALLPADSSATIDPDFAKDVEEAIAWHREP